MEFYIFGGLIIFVGICLRLWANFRRNLFETEIQYKEYAKTKSNKILQNVWVVLSYLFILTGIICIWMEYTKY